MIPLKRPTVVFLAIAAMFFIAAAVTFQVSRRNAEALSPRWSQSTAEEITAAVVSVGRRVQRMQGAMIQAAGDARSFLIANLLDEHADRLDVRLETFRLLEEMAGRLDEDGHVLRGTEVGIQLFDAELRRVAWAGWPQRLDDLDHRFMRGNNELLYVRHASPYQLLTHITPIRFGDRRLGTLLIDLPLEVNYKVNNRFLQSANLVDDLPKHVASMVRFDYYTATASLPEQIRALGNNPRAKAALPEPGADVPPESLLVYAELPAGITPLGRIAGDAATGLSGRVRVKSVLRNSLFDVVVQGRPLRYFARSNHDRMQIVAMLCLLGALSILFILSLIHFPKRLAGPLDAVKALYLVGFFALTRYMLLSVQPAVFISVPKVFDPAVFATPMLGGVMRSAGDLLITAIFFVTALYGVLKITRDAAVRQRKTDKRGASWMLVPKALVTTLILIGVFHLAREFIGAVVVNANPHLLGETMRWWESHVVVLHLSTFLMIAGIFLAGVIVIWGVHRFRGVRFANRSAMLASVLILLISLFLGWGSAFICLMLLLFAALAPRIVQREDLVSTVFVAFGFVIIVSTATYVFLNNEYQELRKSFIQEKVAEITHPSDNWKVFILEDVLEAFSKDNTIRRTLTGSPGPHLDRLAFELWAGSSLSLLGYTSAVYVFDEADSVLSQFSVDMPYRVRLAGHGERMETSSSQEWVVLDLTTNTPQGIVRFYRGIVNISDYVARRDGHRRRSIGKIVVDIPFFFQNLTLAARTGPRTPEVLRNVQQGGISPRQEETEAILLARLHRTRVMETSSDVLPVGFVVGEGDIAKATDLGWPILRTSGSSYRFLLRETEAGSYLLAGFRVPLLMQHLLRWSTILSLYFFFAVAIIILIILLKSITFLRAVLPTLTPGRQVGFQQKLLGSFLLIALLPAVFLGVFAVQLIEERFVQENRKEALNKVYSASKSLDNLLVGELNYLFDHTDVQKLLEGDASTRLNNNSGRLFRVIPVSEAWGREDADRTGVAALDSTGVVELDRWRRMVETFTAERVFVHQENGTPYIGIFSHPLTLRIGDDIQTLVVYYARELDGDVLAEIADQVGADVNIYDGGQLIASSREGLLTGGFISASMDAKSFVTVSLMEVSQSVTTENAGAYRYEVAYLPTPSSRPDESAAIGLPLLFKPESFNVQVQKATSVVLSVFALLAAATLGLGLLLARGIFEPLKGLLEGTQRIAQGDLTFRLPAMRHDEIGTVVAAFNEMTDKLAHSQTALEERRRYLEVILANIATGVISTDANNRIVAVNESAERILGIESRDVVGLSADELAGKGVAEQFFSLVEKESDTGVRFVSSEVDIVTDGEKRTIKYVQTRLTGDDQYIGTVYVFEDLTELIRSKKLSAWVEMARQIAHEIKNPLTPIKLSTQFMVKAHAENAKQFDKIFKESTDTIIRQVDVLRRIASEFSSFGRSQELDVAPHPVVASVEEIIAPYRQNTEGVDISFETVSQDYAAVLDREALRKICTNLVENAMEAMPKGGELHVRCDEVSENGRSMVAISFRDTGPGLSDDAKERLFEPYFSTKTTGTGLGLAICRRLSREMGGDVELVNLRNGTGVRATLYLRKV